MKREPQITLNEKNISSLKIPAGKNDKTWFDKETKGFGIRKRINGHSNYVLQYQLFGITRKLNLGETSETSCQKARLLATAKRGQISDAKLGKGLDPAAERERLKEAAQQEANKPKVNTLGGLIAFYLAAKKDTMRARTYAGASYNLNVLLKPLHSLTVGAATTRVAIAAQVRTIAKKNGLVSANRARASLSAMFRWALGEVLCDSNPVTGTNKQEENRPRERSLTDAEAATVFTTAPENDYGHIVRLLLLTGCRRTELGDLKRSEFDASARTITLPPDRTKNGQAHVVPLGDEAMAILQSIPQRAERDCFFGSGKRGYSGWSKSKTALDKAAKIAPWTLHDLRRTVRTGLGMLGVAPHIAEAALNHLPPKLIRTYDKNKYEAEKRAALELWASHLAVAVAQASGANVTRLARHS